MLQIFYLLSATNVYILETDSKDDKHSKRNCQPMNCSSRIFRIKKIIKIYAQDTYIFILQYIQRVSLVKELCES